MLKFLKLYGTGLSVVSWHAVVFLKKNQVANARKNLSNKSNVMNQNKRGELSTEFKNLS